MNNSSEKYDNIPNIIENQIILKKPNSPIIISKGNFELINLKNESEKIEVNGKIYFEWFPNYGCFFSGTISNNDFNRHIQNTNPKYKVVINKKDVGNCFVVNTTTTLSEDRSQIKGKFENKIIIGDIGKSIDLVTFSIPNLKSISGEVVKSIKGTSSSRIKLENNEWCITIDKDPEYHKLEQELKMIGGYNILYFGNIIKVNNTKFSYLDSNEIISCLDVFLSFINGRKLSCLFTMGFDIDDKIWCDYNSKRVDTYKDVKTFLFYRNIQSLDLMWKKFSCIWQTSDGGKDFLTSIIHWYTESNNQAGLIEGSIIMAQAGLEQLYYWTTSNTKHPNNTPSKLRSLIKYLNLKNSGIPENYKNLKLFAHTYIEDPEYRDIPGIITTIRNNIVHPIEKIKISLEIKHEAWQLCLWLIEITLLKILNHKGRYFDRTRREYRDYESPN